jgi:hypothetical protein
MLNRIILLCSAIAIAGAYAAGYSRATNSNKINAMQATIDTLNRSVVAERAMITVANKKSQELAIEVHQEKLINEGAKNEIEKDKDRISKLNTINHEFLQYIQLAETNNMPASAGVTQQSRASSSNIPADRVLHYTVDLRSAYNQCMHQANKLIAFYNEQRAIVNY